MRQPLRNTRPLPLPLSPLLLLLLLLPACQTGGETEWDDLHERFALAESSVAVAAEAVAHDEVVTPREDPRPSVPEPPLLAPPRPAYPRGPVVEEMRRLYIRDPEMLLDALESASEADGPPLSFLLAIAHAETNGRPLLISSAGAVGLAQATPSAYLLEGGEGPLHVTSDYVEGMRAYILKKPLGDAVAIASTALGERRAQPSQIPALLADARRLSDVGLDELRLLTRWYDGDLEADLAADQKRNHAVLDEVERIIATGDLEQIEEFRDNVRLEYRALMSLQQSKWKQYELELTARRDVLLYERFGARGRELRGEKAYDAGEYLAQVLDARFSPAGAASFLVQHLQRKMAQAAVLSTGGDLTSLASALYNGGAHNVLRMQAGLIESLPETDRYSMKVPNTRNRIEAAMLNGTVVTGQGDTSEAGK